MKSSFCPLENSHLVINTAGQHHSLALPHRDTPRLLNKSLNRQLSGRGQAAEDQEAGGEAEDFHLHVGGCHFVTFSLFTPVQSALFVFKFTILSHCVSGSVSVSSHVPSPALKSLAGRGLLTVRARWNNYGRLD